jgi:hypothetical protein
MRFFLVFFISTLFVGCNASKNNSTGKEKNSFFILKIQSAFEQKIDPEEFYCFIELKEEEIQFILNQKYNSKYDFYDTLRFRANAKCILDYGEKYWENSCRNKKFNVSKSKDILTDETNIIGKLKNNKNYSFNFYNIENPLGTILYIGISPLKVIEFCNVYSTNFVCGLPRMDSVLILKKIQFK